MFEYVISTFGEAKPPTLQDLRDFEAKELLRPVKRELEHIIDLDDGGNNDTSNILDMYRKTPKNEPPDVSFFSTTISRKLIVYNIFYEE